MWLEQRLIKAEKVIKEKDSALADFKTVVIDAIDKIEEAMKKLKDGISNDI